MYKPVATLLKFFLPRTFLKRGFLVYNQWKIKTWDKLFFRPLDLAQSDFIIYGEKNPFTEAQVNTRSFEDRTQRGFALWQSSKWTQDEYLLIYNKSAFIEPKTGWSVTPQHRLIYPSLGFSRAPYVHKPSWIQTYLRKPAIVEWDNVISLRDTGEENYFHFFNDILSKLFFLQERGFDLSNYTIVVSERLYSKSYFQYYFKNTFLGSLTWHVQQSEWIRFKTAVFCKPFTHTVRYLQHAVDLVAPRSSESNCERKVFLTRGKNTARFLQNDQDIYNQLKQYGYERIDASDLSFEEQMQLFRDTRYLIAVHGAGITNILFRNRAPLSILELVPMTEHIPFHYIMLAKQMKFEYDVIVGSEQLSDGGFLVNINEIEKYILKNQNL